MLRSTKLLIVEDNEGDIRLVREALKRLKTDCRLTVVKDGVAAIETLRNNVGPEGYPDLILLDLNLPLKDGREVLKEIKEDQKLMHIPVLVLTGSRAPDDVLAAYRLHANCYLTKPGRISEFFAMLEDIEEFWIKAALLPSVDGAVH